MAVMLDFMQPAATARRPFAGV